MTDIIIWRRYRCPRCNRYFKSHKREEHHDAFGVPPKCPCGQEVWERHEVGRFDRLRRSLRLLGKILSSAWAMRVYLQRKPKALPAPPDLPEPVPHEPKKFCSCAENPGITIPLMKVTREMSPLYSMESPEKPLKFTEPKAAEPETQFGFKVGDWVRHTGWPEIIGQVITRKEWNAVPSVSSAPTEFLFVKTDIGPTKKVCRNVANDGERWAYPRIGSYKVWELWKPRFGEQVVGHSEWSIIVAEDFAKVSGLQANTDTVMIKGRAHNIVYEDLRPHLSTDRSPSEEPGKKETVTSTQNTTAAVQPTSRKQTTDWKPKVGDWVWRKKDDTAAGGGGPAKVTGQKSQTQYLYECHERYGGCWLSDLRPLEIHEIKTMAQGEQFRDKLVRARIGDPRTVGCIGRICDIRQVGGGPRVHLRLLKNQDIMWAYPDACEIIKEIPVSSIPDSEAENYIGCQALVTKSNKYIAKDVQHLYGPGSIVEVVSTRLCAIRADRWWQVTAEPNGCRGFYPKREGYGDLTILPEESARPRSLLLKGTCVKPPECNTCPSLQTCALSAYKWSKTRIMDSRIREGQVWYEIACAHPNAYPGARGSWMCPASQIEKI